MSNPEQNRREVFQRRYGDRPELHSPYSFGSLEMELALVKIDERNGYARFEQKDPVSSQIFVEYARPKSPIRRIRSYASLSRVHQLAAAVIDYQNEAGLNVSYNISYGQQAMHLIHDVSIGIHPMGTELYHSPIVEASYPAGAMRPQSIYLAFGNVDQVVGYYQNEGNGITDVLHGVRPGLKIKPNFGLSNYSLENARVPNGLPIGFAKQGETFFSEDFETWAKLEGHQVMSGNRPDFTGFKRSKDGAESWSGSLPYLDLELLNRLIRGGFRDYIQIPELFPITFRVDSAIQEK